MNFNVHRYASKTEAIDSLLQNILNAITEKLTSQNNVNLALAGGTTPKPLYEILSLQSLPWERIKLTLTDERWVPIQDNLSNEKMLRACFREQESLVKIIGLKNAEESALLGQSLCNLMIKKSVYPLDIGLLGMGEDGHFASIFPGESLIEQISVDENQLCLAVAPENQVERMSLSMACLLTAPYLFFLMGGDKKMEQLNRAVKGDTSLPIHHLLKAAKQTIQVYWFKDE